MTNDETAFDRLRADLDDWRAKLDHLRVQANLGRMEARDKLRELEERFGPSIRDARSRVEELVETGSTEMQAIGKSLMAGWDEVRRTHRELVERAERERGDS